MFSLQPQTEQDSEDADVTSPREPTPEPSETAGGESATQRRLRLSEEYEVPRENEVDQLQRWYINTRTMQVRRTSGQKLGMVVYSEVGSYGTKVESVKPNSSACLAGLRKDDVFVRLGDTHVLHLAHRELVQVLSQMPDSFECEVADKGQMPLAKGKYQVKIRKTVNNSRHPGAVRSQATLQHNSEESDWLEPLSSVNDVSETYRLEQVSPQSAACCAH